MSRDGVDCSGLVCLVFRELWNKELPRSATDMATIGSEVRLDDARPGDLLFFRWRLMGGPDHVGIYIGGGRFVHASTRLGVIESTLADDYYGSHFIAMRRVVL
jgi:cell wall-associated NlpC family hydrolase